MPRLVWSLRDRIYRVCVRTAVRHRVASGIGVHPTLPLRPPATSWYAATMWAPYRW
jgi:hypothetical protein